MMSRLVAMLAIAGAVATASQVIRTPEDKDFMTVRMNPIRLTYLPPPLADVRTYSKLSGVVSSSEATKIPLDTEVTLLCGVVNDGDQRINVTGIMGSLNMPESFQFYYVNFTYKFYGDVVEPGQEMSFAYSFKLRAEDLAMVNDRAEESPTPVQMAMSVFYEEDGSMPGGPGSEYSATFFNETVSIVPSDKPLDFSFLQRLVVDLAVGGAVLFAVAYGVFGERAVDALPAPLRATLKEEAGASAADAGAAGDAGPRGSTKGKSKSKGKGKGKGKGKH